MGGTNTSTQTIARNAAQSHIRPSETRCSNTHAITQIRNRNTTVQHPTHCARHSAGNARPRRASYIARMTQPRFFNFAGDQRRAPRYHHTTYTHAQTHDMRQATPSTTARQRHGACHPTQRTPTSRAPHIAHSHAAYKHTSPRTLSGHPAQPRPLRTAQASLYAHRNTHATHRQQKITPSHTRGRRHTLTTELSGCPASTGCCRTVGCQSSTTACRTHEHTMASDTATADPSQPPATHPRTPHSINQITPDESQSAHCTLSLTHNTVCE